MFSPKIEKTNNTPTATVVARMAIRRRLEADMPDVRATNNGISPIGSITTNKATKAVIRKLGSNAVCPYRLECD